MKETKKPEFATGSADPLYTAEQKKVIQAGQLKELQSAQILYANGDKNAIEFVEGNIDDDYVLPKHDAHTVHARVITVNLNENTKERTEDKKVIQIPARTFDAFVNAGGFLAYDDVSILHDPRPNRPSEYDLKPFDKQPEAVSTDKNTAARERKLAMAERDAAAKQAALDEKLAEADAKLAEMQKIIDANKSKPVTPLATTGDVPPAPNSVGQ